MQDIYRLFADINCGFGEMLQKYNCCIVKNAKKNVSIDFSSTCGKIYNEVEGSRPQSAIPIPANTKKGGSPLGKIKAMNDVLKQLSLIGIVPVIKIDDAKDALPLAKALIDGGLPCAEVTFRTDAAKDAIAAIAKEYPEMIVGAGTVLTPEQADIAVEAGAKFIVSPGLNPDVVRHCTEKGYPIVPGINNPSGIEQALALGLDTVKFFPAENSGGLGMLKAMSAPYGKVKFMPTGGIGPANIRDYLAFNKILCCGGSWMVKADLIAAGDFDGIRRLTEQAVSTMLNFEVAHVGINTESEAAADADAATLAKAFGFAPDKRSKSVFAGTQIEIMNMQGAGTKGHIGIRCASVDRAVYHLERKGFEFDYDTAVYAPDGSMKFIYMKGEIGGFAYHLVK